MAREKDRREQILDAAFEEFAQKGFRGATIRSIAGEAGLRSPALIYWYFENKEALLREVLNSRIPIVIAGLDLRSMMNRPPEVVLRMIGRACLELGRNSGALPLMIGEALRRQEVAEMVAKGDCRRVVDFLEKYLRHQAEVGRLRPHNTRSSAWSFMGMLLLQVGDGLLLPGLADDGLNDEEYLDAVTKIFLRGLDPEGGSRMDINRGDD